MKYKEKILKIDEKIKNREYESAEQDLLNIINEEKIKTIEDKEYLHFSFDNYIELLIYWRKFKPSKKILQPDNNIAEVYFLLGFINFETKNYGKALQYLDKASEWNPISPRIRMEKADTYRNIGEYERYRIEVEKAYPYIYDSTFMSKYFRELGWYYSEKRIFNLANALYTQSTAFMNTELARNELIYIAQQEHRDPRFSTKEEINTIFKEYNIPIEISNEITQMIYEDSQQLIKENNIQLANYLYMALYDITLDARFMLYSDLKDDTTGITARIPKTWKIVNKETYSKFGINDNTVFLFITPQNERVSVVCDGKCDLNQLQQAYDLNIENLKKHGIKIEREYTIRGQKNINQVVTLIEGKEGLIRIYHNYLVVNGYLFNVSWKLPSNIPLENLMKSKSNIFKIQMIFSLKGINEDTLGQEVMNEINARLIELLAQGMTMQEAIEMVFGDNHILRKIKEEFNSNGITEKNVELLHQLAVQTIKDNKQDPYWSDTSREAFKLLILSNLINNKDFVLSDLAEQTKDVELSREIINNNLEKLDVPELQKTMAVKQILSSDKPFKSVIEIIQESVKPYERTELQKQGREEMQDNKKPKANQIIVKCPTCNNEFKLNWNVPASEKTFYCKCPNCNAEIKSENPNYKD